MKRSLIIVSFVVASALSGFAFTKVIATDHAHSEADVKKWRLGAVETGHSGGLDQNGGHYDRKNGGYHYHR